MLNLTLSEFHFSLSGCPRALYAKKKAKFPTEDYLSTKFRASDGKMVN